MKGHCACQATGSSSHAIARALGHCRMGGIDHPWDPADLRRCINYCRETSISTERLAEVMAPVSREWAALVQVWDDLARLLADEIEYGNGRNAPLTYRRMKRLLDSARKAAS